MLERLLELAYSPGTPVGVRAKALQDLLDRAGGSAANKLSVTGEINTTLMETRHTAEFAKRARELIAQMELQRKSQD